MKVIIELKEFRSLVINVSVTSSKDEINGQEVETLDSFKGNVTVDQEELAETMGAELEYCIKEFGDWMPEWDFIYKFEVKGFKFEVNRITKIENEIVYFEVV